MPFPPFLIDQQPAAGTTAARAVDGSDAGTTLNTRPGPHAEMRITYRTQFRIHRIWQTQVETPCWPGDVPAGELEAAIAAGNAQELPAGDRVLQTDLQDNATVKFGRKTMKLILGESESNGRRVWIPLDRRLPQEAMLTTEGWNWTAPKKINPRDNQWGLRGDMTVVSDPWGEPGEPMDFKMVTVWQRWEFGKQKGKKRYGDSMCTLPPGIYAGYVRTLNGRSASRSDRADYPAIWVGYTWEPQIVDPALAASNGSPAAAGTSARKAKAKKDKDRQGPWRKKVNGWTMKNPEATRRTNSIFVHPGSWPQAFLGCLAPGPMDKQREWGFAERDDTVAAMWEILAAVGVSKEAYTKDNSFRDPDKTRRKWFLIRVEAANDDVIKGDGWQRQRIWVPQPQPATASTP